MAQEQQIHRKIGKNLQNIRKARSLSLDQVAELTGVSKAMLGQIERGDSNPTISILWKIVNGLHISFTSLIEDTVPKVTHIRLDEIEPLLEEDGKYRSFPIVPFEQKKQFEIYSVEIDVGCTYASEAHFEGVEEYILMTSGALQLRIQDEAYALKAGDAIHFSADQPHVYENIADEKTKFNTIICYPV